MASVALPTAPSTAAVPATQPLPAHAVVDPRIDVCAQFALLRMRQGDPAARAAAAGLLSAVKTGELAGIYADNVKASAQLAAKLGLTWWKLIPAGQDAALVVDPATSPPGRRRSHFAQPRRPATPPPHRRNAYPPHD